MLIKAAWFDLQKCSKNSNNVKYYYNFIQLFSILIYFKIEFIPVMQSWIFTIITAVFGTPSVWGK